MTAFDILSKVVGIRDCKTESVQACVVMYLADSNRHVICGENEYLQELERPLYNEARRCSCMRYYCLHVDG
jgi:hypothetical protein